jgi:hypothetical protein
LWLPGAFLQVSSENSNSIAKSVVIFLMMKNQRVPSLTAEDIAFYKNIGILVNEKKKEIDTLNTLVYDAAQGFLGIVLTIIYRLHYNDVQKGTHTIFESTPRMLHPHFDTHGPFIFQWAVLYMTTSAVFVQTLVQAFILLLIAFKVGAWAYGLADDRQNSRILVLTFSQALLLCQFLLTFII